MGGKHKIAGFGAGLGHSKAVKPSELSLDLIAPNSMKNYAGNNSTKYGSQYNQMDAIIGSGGAHTVTHANTTSMSQMLAQLRTSSVTNKASPQPNLQYPSNLVDHTIRNHSKELPGILNHRPSYYQRARDSTRD